MPIRAAIFDRDGVLTTTDRALFQRDVLSRLPLPEAEVARRWRAWLAGRALHTSQEEQQSIHDFLIAMADELGLEGATRNTLLELDYTGCVRGQPDARAALIAVRERGLRVGVLTNNSAAVSPVRMLEVAGLADLVDVALSAQMIGAAKPDAQAYRAIVGALDVTPAECFFIDNTPAWCSAARALGMRAWCLERSRAAHALAEGVIRDLSAVPLILDLA